MGWNGLGSSWQYSRWLKNTARNCRITNPEGVNLFVWRIVVATFCYPTEQTGTRPWLYDAFYRKAVAAGPGYEYSCDIGEEPAHVIVELMEIIGRDLKKIPITNAEKALLDAAFSIDEAAGYYRRYGTGTYFGGVGGSTVGVP